MIRATGLWLVLSLLALPAFADEKLRVATFNAELYRDGPGLLLRDIRAGKDQQVLAVLDVIRRTSPDILAIQGLDWDFEGRALSAFADALRQAGVDYPHRFAAKPNSGVPSGHDLNDNGRLNEAADAWGYGRFTGQGGLAVLSRYPIDAAGIQDYTGFLWRDLPGHLMPSRADSTPFPSARIHDTVPLSGSAHWVVPILLPDGTTLTLLTYRAVPPVFDGPEDFNGRRNHDETRFWSLFLDGAFGSAPKGRFVLAGSPTMDPDDSDGRPGAVRALLADPRVQDVKPVSPGAAAAEDQGHVGDNALDTVDWPVPGRLRADYVLPSSDWTVAGAGVFWPLPGQPGHNTALSASRHRLVWVDLVPNPAP